MRLRLRLFGCTICSLLFEAGPAEQVSDTITGGAGVYLERDLDPPDPMRQQPWEEDFGFQ